MKKGYVYILANHRNGTIYTGVTSNLIKRVYEHRTHAAKGFTSRYGVTKLVFYEGPLEIYTAISREKQIKNWRRAWKLALVEENNPFWKDLYLGIL